MAVFPQKRVDSSVDLQRMPLWQSHINRVTFSRTSTLPMANSGCLCPVIVAGWRAGRLGGLALQSDCRSHVTALSPTANTMFSMAVWRGTVAGPLHWRAGWQTGSLARPIALNAYFRQETVHS